MYIKHENKYYTDYSVVNLNFDTYLLGHNWSGFEAAKTAAPRPSRGLHHFGKFLEPSDE